MWYGMQCVLFTLSKHFKCFILEELVQWSNELRENRNIKAIQNVNFWFNHISTCIFSMFARRTLLIIIFYLLYTIKYLESYKNQLEHRANRWKVFEYFWLKGDFNINWTTWPSIICLMANSGWVSAKENFLFFSFAKAKFHKIYESTWWAFIFNLMIWIFASGRNKFSFYEFVIWFYCIAFLL